MPSVAALLLTIALAAQTGPPSPPPVSGEAGETASQAAPLDVEAGRGALDDDLTASPVDELPLWEEGKKVFLQGLAWSAAGCGGATAAAVFQYGVGACTFGYCMGPALCPAPLVITALLLGPALGMALSASTVAAKRDVDIPIWLLWGLAAAPGLGMAFLVMAGTAVVVLPLTVLLLPYYVASTGGAASGANSGAAAGLALVVWAFALVATYWLVLGGMSLGLPLGAAAVALAVASRRELHTSSTAPSPQAQP